MKKVKIYCLKDPRDLAVRYVGKTITPLYDRLKVHIYQSKTASKHTHKEAWIKQLLNLGLKPVIELIEEVDEFIWIEREKYWINFYKNLTNLSEGGDGGFCGGKHTEEYKEYLRINFKSSPLYKSGLGRKWTEEQREKRRLIPAWNKGLSGIFNHTDEWKKERSNNIKGENHPMCKLSDNDILSIRERHDKGVKPIDLSKKYDIDYSYLYKILTFKNRK